MEKKPPLFKKFKFSRNIQNGIYKKGYKHPTPIQTKAIPIILERKDVIATSRTGSGKTATFLLPILHFLNDHSPDSGVRALLIAPTRELSLQIHKELVHLAKFTTLRSCVLVGGECFDEQFFSLRRNPDIVIATPGRLFHILNETSVKLNKVRYVVFDEADRLFELGFATQINAILQSLPKKRQTMLFSATMPPVLTDFSKAALTLPVFISLEFEDVLSKNLECHFVSVHSDEKTAGLVFLIQKFVLDLSLRAIVFCATRHEVEYLCAILSEVKIPNEACYGSMGQVLRKERMERFESCKRGVLVVTDLAARGLDLPRLDCVINFSFPPQPKLFVHRVGRVARLNRSGRAFSLVAPDENPFLVETAIHLGISVFEDKQRQLGEFPRSILDPLLERLQKIEKELEEIKNLKKSWINGNKMYKKTRSGVSKHSLDKTKLLKISPVHPLFEKFIPQNKTTKDKEKFKNALKNYKSSSTIFEVFNAHKSGRKAMAKKRNAHKFLSLKKGNEEDQKELEPKKTAEPFENLKGKNFASISLAERKNFRDTKNYIKTEKTLEGKGKANLADKEHSDFVVPDKNLIELAPDEMGELNKRRYKKWNSKRRKFEHVTEIDGKEMRKRKKLFKGVEKKTNLQLAWERSKKSLGKKDKIGRWGGVRKNRYVKRID